MTMWLRPSASEPGIPLNIYRNMSGSTLLRGTPVVLYTTAVDGVSVTLAAAATLGLFQGVAYEDILDGEQGRFQIGGYCDYALVANHANNATAIGDMLGLVAGAAYFQRIDGSGNHPAIARALEVIAANAVITSAERKILLGIPGC